MDYAEIKEIMRQLNVIGQKMDDLAAEQQALKRRLDAALEENRRNYERGEEQP
jgi:hypothetical protein